MSLIIHVSVSDVFNNVCQCFCLKARNIALHEESETDVITGLKQKTNYGRPNWDSIFEDVANKHKGWAVFLKDFIRDFRLFKFLILLDSISQLIRFPCFREGPQNDLHQSDPHNFKATRSFRMTILAFHIASKLDHITISYHLKTVLVSSTVSCATSCTLWSKVILVTQESCSLYRRIVKNINNIFTFVSHC